MDRNIELYIIGKRIDLFKFEDINITDKIQDARDISKVFTSYSKTFTVPCSPLNNSVFKHYYNMDIYNGFDARIKVDAEIKIGGATYKQGKLSLTKVSLKNGKPYSYTIVFYGQTVSLKELFGDEYLSDIKNTFLDDFSFSYNSTFVQDGLTDGYSYDGSTLVIGGNDLTFPLISSENYYFYDSNPTGISPKDGVESRNICTTATPPSSANKGLYFKDLKPALRVHFIIKAIEERYGIVFSDDFFNINNKAYYDLSLWLQRESGKIDKQLDVTSKVFNLSDLGYSGSDNYIGKERPQYSGLPTVPNVDNDSIQLVKLYYQGINYSQAYFYSIDFDINVVGTGLYTVKIIDEYAATDVELYTFTGSGNHSVEWKLDHFNLRQIPYASYRTYTPKILVETTAGITSFSIANFKIRDWEETVEPDGYNDFTLIGTEDYTYSGGGSVSLGEGVTMWSQFPKIKVIDFLTSIFKMFNLTAYYDDTLFLNNKIVVKPLDNYYNSGRKVNLSKYLDVSKIDVERNVLYNEVDFDFKSSKSFAVTKSNEITGDDFGAEKLTNLSQSLNNPLAFDGGKYSVAPMFEKMMYERMNDQVDETVILPIGWGWSASKDEKAIKLEPLLFYPIKQDNSVGLDDLGNSTMINFDKSTYDKDMVIISPIFTSIGTHIRPSNSTSSFDAMINFGVEYDEFLVWDNINSISNNLFYMYYRRYVLSLYNLQSRVVKYNFELPTNVLLTLKPNDIIVVNNKEYLINNMDINISNGKSKFELMNNIAYTEYPFALPSFTRLDDTLLDVVIRVDINELGLYTNKWNVYINNTLSSIEVDSDNNIYIPKSTGDFTIQVENIISENNKIKSAKIDVVI